MRWRAGAHGANRDAERQCRVRIGQLARQHQKDDVTLARAEGPERSQRQRQRLLCGDATDGIIFWTCALHAGGTRPSAERYRRSERSALRVMLFATPSSQGKALVPDSCTLRCRSASKNTTLVRSSARSRSPVRLRSRRTRPGRGA